MEQGRFPNRLKTYRLIAGYSQKKVTRLMRLGDACVLSRWERGITSPNIGQVLWLARLYHTQPHLLYEDLWNNSVPECDLLALHEPSSNQQVHSA